MGIAFIAWHVSTVAQCMRSNMAKTRLARRATCVKRIDNEKQSVQATMPDHSASSLSSLQDLQQFLFAERTKLSIFSI